VPDENGIAYRDLGDSPADPMRMVESLPALDRQTMTRGEFNTRLEQFEHLRITSGEGLRQRTKDALDLIRMGNVYVVSFHPYPAAAAPHSAPGTSPSSTTAPHGPPPSHAEPRHEPAAAASDTNGPSTAHAAPASSAHSDHTAHHDPAEVGYIFVQHPHFRMYDPHELEILRTTYAKPKWIFFAIGIIGFIFLWRRGGDSSLARWIGIWLIGISLIPTLNVSDDTLPHLTHWLWRQSVLYHWNSLGSTAQPLFAVLYLAAASAGILWMTQASPAVVWAYLCWPTPTYPQWPILVRQAIIVGKILAVFCGTFGIYAVTVFPLMLLFPRANALPFIVFLAASTLAFVIVGGIVRHFTARTSEVPRLSFWAVLAVVTLNLTVIL
jgi:hypothetical protein